MAPALSRCQYVAMEQHDQQPSVPGRRTRSYASRLRAGILAALFIVIIQACAFGITLSVIAGITSIPVAAIRSSAPSSTLQVLSLLACEIAFALAIIGFARFMSYGPIWRVPGQWTLLRGIAALSPVLVVFALLPVAELIASGDPVVSSRLAGGLVPAIIALAIVVGIAEEIAYRHVLVEVLGGAAQPWLATIISALLFGVSHISSGESYVVANAAAAGLAVGIPFAAVRVAGAPLASLVVVHAAIDTCALLRLGGLDLSNGPDNGNLLAMVSTAGVIAAGYLVWLGTAPRRSRASSE